MIAIKAENLPLLCHSDTSASSVQALGGILLNKVKLEAKKKHT